jgi:hypothetical protein
MGAIVDMDMDADCTDQCRKVVADLELQGAEKIRGNCLGKGCNKGK